MKRLLNKNILVKLLYKWGCVCVNLEEQQILESDKQWDHAILLHAHKDMKFTAWTCPLAELSADIWPHVTCERMYLQERHFLNVCTYLHDTCFQNVKPPT